MKKNLTRVAVYICVVLGLSASTVFAELGLGQMTAAEAGEAVQQAIAGDYDAGKSEEEIKARIKDILAEAAATENEDVMTATVVAVFKAGGAERVDFIRDVVNEAVSEATTSGSALGGFQAAVNQAVVTQVGVLTGNPAGSVGGGLSRGTEAGDLDDVDESSDIEDGDSDATPT